MDNYISREKRIGIDEKTFYEIITQSFPSELELIDKIYFQRHNHKLLNAINIELSFNNK